MYMILEKYKGYSYIISSNSSFENDVIYVNIFENIYKKHVKKYIGYSEFILDEGIIETDLLFENIVIYNFIIVEFLYIPKKSKINSNYLDISNNHNTFNTIFKNSILVKWGFVMLFLKLILMKLLKGMIMKSLKNVFV